MPESIIPEGALLCLQTYQRLGDGAKYPIGELADYVPDEADIQRRFVESKQIQVAVKLIEDRSQIAIEFWSNIKKRIPEDDTYAWHLFAQAVLDELTVTTYGKIGARKYQKTISEKELEAAEAATRLAKTLVELNDMKCAPVDRSKAGYLGVFCEEALSVKCLIQNNSETSKRDELVEIPLADGLLYMAACFKKHAEECAEPPIERQSFVSQKNTWADYARGLKARLLSLALSVLDKDGKPKITIKRWSHLFLSAKDWAYLIETATGESPAIKDITSALDPDKTNCRDYLPKKRKK